MKSICWAVGGGLILCMLAFATMAEARVTRIAVENSAPMRENATGIPYIVVKGRVFGELNPTDPRNAIINDIALAPRNAHGMVEYSASFTLARPADISKSSGVLIYDVPNRGSHDVVAWPQGHISLVSGWQADVVPNGSNQDVAVPVAKNKDGSSITGQMLARFVNMPSGTTTMALTGEPIGAASNNVAGSRGGRGGRRLAEAADAPDIAAGGATRGSALVSTSTMQSSLYKQASDMGPITKIKSTDWAFADCSKQPFPGTPDAAKICIKGGFDPKYFYTLSYRVQDPPILGIGLAAWRDTIAFFRYADKDDGGSANPVAGAIRWSIAWGVSQSGNALRTFTHLGFNATEDGKRVFDGIQPIAGARQTPTNFRFAVPGGAAQLYEVGSDGVVWYGDYKDKTRGLETAGLMSRCTRDNTCPKVLENLAASEFWGLRGSPDFVGTDARADLPLPANVRRYYEASSTHGGSPNPDISGSQAFKIESDPARGACLLSSNGNSNGYMLRATLKNLIDWVVSDMAPPPSNYPTLASGQLVPPNAKAMGFPSIPGQPLPDNHINPFYQYDFGPGFNYADLSGVTSKQPPRLVKILPSLVPKVDSDGNEIAGVRSVLVQVPLRTYVGWNVTKEGFYANLACGFAGGSISFARTRSDRLASGDPRPSVEERYGTHENFVTKVRAAAAELVAQRFMLPEDAAKTIQDAEDSDILK